MPVRTSRMAAAGALALAVAACTPDRIASPTPQAISPQIRRLLDEAGPPSDPMAVITADVSDAGTPHLAGTGETGAAATRVPTGPRRDMAEADLSFIVNPSGGKAMGGADPTAGRAFTFFCYNGSTGQWTQMMNVTVNEMQQSTTAGTGGHGTAHSGTKPKGTWQPATGNTASDGRFVSTYTAGIASGDEQMDLTWTVHDTGNPCTGRTATRPFYNAVRYQGLQQLTAQGGLTLSPIGSNHTSVYYATPDAIAAAYRSQAYYDNLTNHTDHLRVNAASLIYGGINDVLNNWTKPHATHRIGTDVDFDGRADSQRVWDQVTLAATRGGGFKYCEIHNRNHVHCYARRY